MSIETNPKTETLVDHEQPEIIYTYISIIPR